MLCLLHLVAAPLPPAALLHPTIIIVLHPYSAAVLHPYLCCSAARLSYCSFCTLILGHRACLALGLLFEAPQANPGLIPYFGDRPYDLSNP